MAVSVWQGKTHVGLDRRSDSRTICEGAALIDVLSPQPRTGVQARVLDVGASSVKLGLPFYLSPGSLIRIRMSDSLANAEVRHCSREGSEYHIGVKVEEITPKDR